MSSVGAAPTAAAAILSQNGGMMRKSAFLRKIGRPSKEAPVGVRGGEHDQHDQSAAGADPFSPATRKSMETVQAELASPLL